MASDADMALGGVAPADQALSDQQPDKPIVLAMDVTRRGPWMEPGGPRGEGGGGSSRVEALSAKAANDPGIAGRAPAPNYQAALSAQRIERATGGGYKSGDFEFWKKIAEQEAPRHDVNGKPNAFLAARNHSIAGEPTVIIRLDGRRKVFQGGQLFDWDPFIRGEVGQ